MACNEISMKIIMASISKHQQWRNEMAIWRNGANRIEMKMA
jgi:hypothetical protein